MHFIHFSVTIHWRCPQQYSGVCLTDSVTLNRAGCCYINPHLQCFYKMRFLRNNASLLCLTLFRHWHWRRPQQCTGVLTCYLFLNDHCFTAPGALPAFPIQTLEVDTAVVLYPCSIKTREVLGNPSPTPERFPETREISQGQSPREISKVEGNLEQICQMTVLMVHKCHKASWQTLTPSLTQANAHLNFNFHCIYKCHKPSWQRFRL